MDEGRRFGPGGPVGWGEGGDGARWETHNSSGQPTGYQSSKRQGRTGAARPRMTLLGARWRAGQRLSWFQHSSVPEDSWVVPQTLSCLESIL